MSKFKLAAVALALAMVAAACGGDDAETVPPTTAAPTTTTTTVPPTTTTTMPPTTTTEPPLPNLVERGIEAGRFTTLLELAQIAQLDALLTAPGPFTVFAPNDDAFAALPEGTIDALKADPDAATKIPGLLLGHALAVQLDSEAIAGATTLTAASNATITVEVDADGNIVLNGVAKIINADIIASNGVIHEIDTVLIPEGLLG